MAAVVTTTSPAWCVLWSHSAPTASVPRRLPEPRSSRCLLRTQRCRRSWHRSTRHPQSNLRPHRRTDSSVEHSVGRDGTLEDTSLASLPRYSSHCPPYRQRCPRNRHRSTLRPRSNPGRRRKRSAAGAHWARNGSKMADSARLNSPSSRSHQRCEGNPRSGTQKASVLTKKCARSPPHSTTAHHRAPPRTTPRTTAHHAS